MQHSDLNESMSADSRWRYNNTKYFRLRLYDEVC